MKVAIVLMLALFSGCSFLSKPTAAIYFFNDSDKTILDVQQNKKPIYFACNEDGTTCVRSEFPLVCMSEGKYRRITMVEP